MTHAKHPDDMVGRTIPDIALRTHEGRPYALRRCVERTPLVLFFYLRNGTPG